MSRYSKCEHLGRCLKTKVIRGLLFNIFAGAGIIVGLIIAIVCTMFIMGSIGNIFAPYWGLDPATSCYNDETAFLITHGLPVDCFNGVHKKYYNDYGLNYTKRQRCGRGIGCVEFPLLGIIFGFILFVIGALCYGCCRIVCLSYNESRDALDEEYHEV